MTNDQLTTHNLVNKHNTFTPQKSAEQRKNESKGRS